VVFRVVSSATFKRTLTCAAALLISVSASAAPASNVRGIEARPGEFIIKFRKTDRSDTAKKRTALRTKLRVRVKKNLALTGAQVVVSSAKGVDEAAAKDLLAQGIVEYIEPNYIYHALAVPNDPRFGTLWGMHNAGTVGTADIDIDAPEAWEITQGGDDVVVGVVDTGIRYDHPDLQPNIWVNPGEVAGNGIDDDGNGVIDDVHGFNAITSGGDPLDDNGHGTHCAGTIGANGNDGTGVAGVNWHVKLMALKFLAASGAGTVDDAVEAINYAVQARARGVNLRVLSNSWGGAEESQALEDAIQAANQAGILFVAAAANNGSDNDASPIYPSSSEQPNVVSVAAVDPDGNLADFSNFGSSSVDLAAPGVNIWSTWHNGDYRSLSGTSMAAPHVAGVAALLCSYVPGLGPAQLRERLMQTVKPLPALLELMGAPGMVSAYNAIMDRRIELPAPERLPGYSHRSIALNASNEVGVRVLNLDDGYVEVLLPFQFPFYGEPIDRLAVSSNGRVVPLADGDAVPTSADYSNRPQPGIAVYHDDLYPMPGPGGGVFVSADGGKVVITWSVIPFLMKNSADPRAPMKFQLSLNIDGSMEFRYIDTESGTLTFDNGYSATIGVAPISGVRGERAVVSHNVAAPETLGSGKAIVLSPRKLFVQNEIDGDNLSDLILFNHRSGGFRILGSRSSFQSARTIRLGKRGDRPFVCDIDADGSADLLTYRHSDNRWHYRRSKEGYGKERILAWGDKHAAPLVGDFDGDRKCDLGLFNAKLGKTTVLLSSGGFDLKGAKKKKRGAIAVFKGGTRGDRMLVSDLNGDGRDDLSRIAGRGGRQLSVSDIRGQRSKIDVAGPGSILACDLRSTGKSVTYLVSNEADGRLSWTESGKAESIAFGASGDTPSCGSDFDGDGKDDLSVYRSANRAVLFQSSASSQEVAIPGIGPNERPVS